MDPCQAGITTFVCLQRLGRAMLRCAVNDPGPSRLEGGRDFPKVLVFSMLSLIISRAAPFLERPWIADDL